MGSFTKNDLLYRFVYGIILLKTLINKVYKIFSEYLIQRIGSGAASDIFWGVIFRRDEALDPRR